MSTIQLVKNNATSSKPEHKPMVVLAFSGGLDTSFCIPYLIDQGYQVTTLFVDSGGVSEPIQKAIADRAIELGATAHHQVCVANELWQSVVIPLIQGGHWYQNQYPLLCSDRYLIVKACLELCDQLDTNLFAHGCTGMGNDQIRFDLTVKSLGQYQIISPIRDIQTLGVNVREYELDYLQSKGFACSSQVTAYSINENILGATISGSEIDRWQAPDASSYVLTCPPEKAKLTTELITFEFNQGQLISLNGKTIDDQFAPKQLLQDLNSLGANYAYGRGIYTGDTTIGLKGRIVFEAPALNLLQTAHQALEHAVLSKSQNRFKDGIANKWTELVYEGLFFDPLKSDLEAFLHSSQTKVSGKVVVALSAGQAQAISVESDNLLINQQSTYAQSADWSIEEATGFIKLFGQSTILANQTKFTVPQSEPLKCNQ